MPVLLLPQRHRLRTRLMSWTRLNDAECPLCNKRGCSAMHDQLTLMTPPSAVLRCLDCKKVFLVLL